MRKTPKMMKADVLVAGGGIAGSAAAIMAARGGSKTVLVERSGSLGGMATAGLVNPFMVSRSASGGLIMSPLFREIIGKLEKQNACVRGELFGQPHIAFDPDALKLILDEMCASAGVNVLFNSNATEVLLRENRFSGARVDLETEQLQIFSGVSIDATGDADLAALAGVPCAKGRPRDGAMQPATLFFRVAGVDESKMPKRNEMDDLFLRAKKEGRITVPREKLLWFETTRPGELTFNVTRIQGIDGTRAGDLKKAEIEGRRQVNEVFTFLKNEMPGFGSSHISAIADRVGIRETRRIIGQYVLTSEDVMSGRRFEDAIASASYPIDIHSPAGSGTTFKPLSKPYDIPFRCLIPKKIENLIVAGRPISVDHEAFSSTRVMPTCMATGEAAGIAAAFSVQSKTAISKIKASDVRNKLIKLGAEHLK